MSIPENYIRKNVQLDLFINEQNIKEKQGEEEFKRFATKSIKGLFARYNDLETRIMNMSDLIEDIFEYLKDKNPSPRDEGYGNK